MLWMTKDFLKIKQRSRENVENFLKPVELYMDIKSYQMNDKRWFKKLVNLQVIEIIS